MDHALKNSKITTIPLALYIHTPWCLSKCPYCDFNSWILSQNSLLEDYLHQLELDLEYELQQHRHAPLTSIYFGGGTPSLLPAAAIANIMKKIQAGFEISSDTEITIEANPGTLNRQWCQDLRTLGINRISLGVQSFQDNFLQRLGRIHNAAQIHEAIHWITTAGFNNFNLDLMFGLPKQQLAEAMQDLIQAINYNPPHLSWYQLTLAFHPASNSMLSQLPTAETIWQIQQNGEALLSQAGWEHYEISAYARTPTRGAIHNLNYWQFGDYLGIGAGAHGKFTQADGSVIRYAKISDPFQYLTATPQTISQQWLVTREQLPFEFMLNALRLNRPLSSNLLWERTGITIDQIAQPLQLAQQRGLLECNGDTFQTTELGKNFLNDLIELFLPNEN